MFELEARSDDVIGAKARGIVEGKVEKCCQRWMMKKVKDKGI